MASVYLETICPKGDAKVERAAVASHEQILSLASHSDRHDLVADPEDADIILLYPFYTLFFGHLDKSRKLVRTHPLRKEFMDKVFVFDHDDEPLPYVPGVYTSLIETRRDKTRQKSGAYFHYLGNPLLSDVPSIAGDEFLFSFVGASSTHELRKRLFLLRHSQGHVAETSAVWPSELKEREQFRRTYADNIAATKFVLCPRGRGSSSVRLFETMQAGRVPVIISDDWVAPTGPDWSQCSVRVPEREVDGIPDVLERIQHDAIEMGATARRVWEKWFSSATVFTRIIDWCLELKAARVSTERIARFRAAMHIWRYREFRRIVTGLIKDRSMSWKTDVLRMGVED